ncbi:hypothetical protein ISS07_01345 [Candidatus Woesearchaeota archaeon]|nr:hypothetical protein [Candidatus Woesearchaeota archaeon]
MIDIVIPCGNEQSFIAMAEKLGYKELCFLYNSHDYFSDNISKIESKISIKTGILAEPKEIDKIYTKLKQKKTFVVTKSSLDNRGIIEKGNIDLIFALEESSSKDFMHQRGSGLDHIMARFMNKNNTSLGFSINSILNAKYRKDILGRVIQNIKLCRKLKVKMAIASFSQNPYDMRSPKDLISLFLKLGMDQKEAKDSLTF